MTILSTPSACRPSTAMIEHRFPLTPGLHASGVVTAIGEGVTGWKAGDEVFGVAEKPYVGEGTYGNRWSAARRLNHHHRDARAHACSADAAS